MSQDLQLKRTGSKQFLSEVLDALNDCTSLNDRDIYDEGIITEYKNFKPARSLELLTERFSSGEIKQPPTAFIAEMKTLISWSNKVIDEQTLLLDKVNKTLKNQLAISRTSGFTGKTPLEKNIREYGKQVTSTVPENVKSLEKKYGIVKSGTATEVITYPRLRFLFPNLIGLRWTTNTLFHSSIFIAPEFGGLIPSKNFKAKKAIISHHLYCLGIHSLIPVHVHHLFLKKRIDEGLLSDEKRLRFLMANGIVEPDGDSTPELLEAQKYMYKLSDDIDTLIEKAEQINGFSLTQNDYAQ